MKKITWLIIVMAILIVIPAWTQENRQVIRAQEFIIEDENGKRGAKVGMDSKGGQLFLYDENGEIFIMIGADNGGDPCISFGKGIPRILLYSSDEKLGLRFFDEKIGLRMELSLMKESPTLIFYDEKEQVRILLALMEGTPGPALVLFDENGNRIAGVH